MSAPEFEGGALRRRPRIEGRLLRRSALGSLRDSMFALLCEHFEGVTRQVFEQDLAQKDWVLALEDERGALQGFTTLAFYESEHHGEVLNVACSGDTIVRPCAWGSPALPRAWIGAIHDLRARHPERRTVWLLLASGFRTFRFLPVFWREFHPHVIASTGRAPALLQHLARERYGEFYDRDAGIVRFPRPQALRPGLREVPSGRLLDPHVRFFLERNPGYLRGDELVCLADLDEANLTAQGRRMLEAARRRRARCRERRA